MHIFFMGQLGIPAKRSSLPTEEVRVEQLSTLLSDQGHTVDVACTRPYSPKNLNRLKNINAIHLPSFNPEKAGGWLYLFFCLNHIWKTQPDVVHMQGWKSGALARVAALLSPESTYIWTISFLPEDPEDKKLLRKLIIWQAKRVFDAIVSPTRTIQYRLLVDFRIKTSYIPDGYEVATIADVPAKHWGLRKGQYSVISLQNEKDLSWILKAYRLGNNKKKVVILAQQSSYISRLQKKYPYLIVLNLTNGRAKYSLLRQAGAVLLMNESESIQGMLQAMDGKRAIIALNKAIFEETLGTSAQFIKPKDSKSLAEIWNNLLKSPSKQAVWGIKAKKRAQAHHPLSRIVEEYLSLYHYPLVRLVPIDSIVAQNPSIQGF